jgi:hypothetical protein
MEVLTARKTEERLQHAYDSAFTYVWGVEDTVAAAFRAWTV